MSAKAAALYLRSSKDRKDVSIENQRQELLELAAQRGLTVTAEFADVVESGKDENRPGFVALLRAMRNKSRGWQTLLMLDTARLARRDYISVMFEEFEAKRNGVRVIYKSVPDANPIIELVVKGIFRTMDHWHSLVSREKGLAGMAENVRSGFRAGGRAPLGYLLEKHNIGIVREGAAVTKSKLIPDPVTAPRVKAYLELRAQGSKRTAAARTAGLVAPQTTLLGVDWNALTYAGATVWNVHNELQPGGGYPDGQKRRPRKDWVINDATHEALITRGQAETILAELESYSPRKGRMSSGKFLLSGMLKTPDGKPWWGDRADYYAATPGGEKRYLKRDEVEDAVLAQVMSDLQSPAFVMQLTRQAHLDAAEIEGDPAKQQRKRITEITGRIGKMMDMAADMENPAPALRKVEELEREREALRAEIEIAEKDSERKTLLLQTSEHKVRKMLVDLADDLAETDRELMKEALFRMIADIQLNPASLHMQINYRVKVASPRGFGLNPTAELRASVPVLWRKRA